MRRLSYLTFFLAFHYVSALGYLFLRELWRSGRAPQGGASASSLVPRPLAHLRAQCTRCSRSGSPRSAAESFSAASSPTCSTSYAISATHCTRILTYCCCPFTMFNIPRTYTVVHVRVQYLNMDN